MSKNIVDSWDLFDTLVARYWYSPDSIFQLMEQQIRIPGFQKTRVQAQRNLDSIGKPYDLYEIYREFGRMTGTADEQAQRELATREIGIEFSQLIPVAKNISRVQPTDLIVTDTYLPEDTVFDILRNICRLQQIRPPIVGNWGKSTGTVWPVIMKHYLVRRHCGDNPHSDFNSPQKFGISTQLVDDYQFTPWEHELLNEGLQSIALLVREVRLRCLMDGAMPMHHKVVGEYLGMLLLFALYVQRHAAKRGIERIVFAARDCVHLAQIFRSLAPEIDSECVDLNRTLLSSPASDAFFASKITPQSAIVDIVSSGRSLYRYFTRTGTHVPVIVLDYYDGLLDDEEKQARKQNSDFTWCVHWKDIANASERSVLEPVCLPGYGAVTQLNVDAGSRAIVRTFMPDDSTTAERAYAAFVASSVTEMVDAIRRRGRPAIEIDDDKVRALLTKAASAIVALRLDHALPTFIMRFD